MELTLGRSMNWSSSGTDSRERQSALQNTHQLCTQGSEQPTLMNLWEEPGLTYTATLQEAGLQPCGCHGRHPRPLLQQELGVGAWRALLKGMRDAWVLSMLSHPPSKALHASPPCLELGADKTDARSWNVHLPQRQAPERMGDSWLHVLYCSVECMSPPPDTHMGSIKGLRSFRLPFLPGETHYRSLL